MVDNEFLRLSIARYQGDDKFVKDLSENFRNELDSLGCHEHKHTPDLYRFSVGNEVLKAGTWQRNRIQGTD
ncbi:MAG: hypothetical protein ACI8YP_000158 [Algoriphagus sp.]|jgi:hypothetical protein